jgi:ubiquinone/menaquinone biosynthesis C-methylase UbiE
MLLALAQQQVEVIGLDLSRAMGRSAGRRLRRQAGEARLVRGRAQSLPFAAASFDSVFATFPTAFIAEQATMTAVYRVLRPGGRFVVVPEGHLTGRGPLQRFIGWLYTITGQRSGTFAVNGEQYWPADTPVWRAWQHQMAAVGFRVAVEHVQLGPSGVTVVIAHKPSR